MEVDISALIFWIGAFNAVMVTLLGLAAAGVFLLGIEAHKFWKRVIPAAAAIVCTSIAGGIIMSVTQWLSGTGA